MAMAVLQPPGLAGRAFLVKARGLKLDRHQGCGSKVDRSCLPCEGTWIETKIPTAQLRIVGNIAVLSRMARG